MNSNKPKTDEAFNGNKLKAKLTIKQKETKDFKLSTVIAITVILLLLFFLYPIISRSSETVSYESAKKAGDIKITFAGDVSPSRNILESFDDNFQPTDLYTDIKNIWNDSDLTMVNLEAVPLKGSVSEYEEGSGNIHLYTDEANVKAIKDAGIDLLALANNHIADYGRVGMVDGMEILDNNQMNYVGLGMNKIESQKMFTKEIAGKTIGIQNITDVVTPGTSASSSLPGAFTTRQLNHMNALEKNFNKADFNIVFVHWGTEYTINPDNEIEEMGHQLIDAGADLVIGSHPHVVHPVEKYNGGTIAYSMGNAVFDQVVSRTNKSAIGSLYIRPDGTQLLEFVPIYINEGRPEKTTHKSYVNETFNTLTKDLGDDDYYIENNKLYIKVN